MLYKILCDIGLCISFLKKKNEEKFPSKLECKFIFTLFYEIENIK